MLHKLYLISNIQNNLKLLFLICIAFSFLPQVKAQNKAPIASILSEGLQKEVAAFIKSYPEMKDEFDPFTQDCIDGKTTDKQCEKNVKEELFVLEAAIQLKTLKTQVNAERAQVKAREAKVNAREAKVNAESEIINRTTIFVSILEINNSIQYGNPNRNMESLGRIKNPILQNDILFLQSIDRKLNQKAIITAQDISKLQATLITHAQQVLNIYSTFTPEQQEEFKETKNMAIGAQKYVIKQ